MPEIGDNKVALWISSITYNTTDETYDLVLSVYSERQLDGIRFKLNHPNDLSNLKVSLILSPLAPISILIGYYLHKKVSENIFYYFIYFFLGIGGIKLIYDGIF